MWEEVEEYIGRRGVDNGKCDMNILCNLFDAIFTCGGLARRSISAPCFLFLRQRMDVLIISANISFSVNLTSRES